MKLTRPEHIGALQLIPGVLRTHGSAWQDSDRKPDASRSALLVVVAKEMPTMSKEAETQKTRGRRAIAVCVGAGLAIGGGIGVAIGSIPMGVGLGTVLGAAIGVAISRRRGATSGS
jgi:hypothetical protein